MSGLQQRIAIHYIHQTYVFTMNHQKFFLKIPLSYSDKNILEYLHKAQSVQCCKTLKDRHNVGRIYAKLLQLK